MFRNSAKSAAALAPDSVRAEPCGGLGIRRVADLLVPALRGRANDSASSPAKRDRQTGGPVKAEARRCGNPRQLRRRQRMASKYRFKLAATKLHSRRGTWVSRSA